MPPTPENPPPGEPPARGESFLARRSGGLTHYLWIALAVTLVLAFIPRGVRKALESNTNKAEDWLPASYRESADLMWFRDHFVGDTFVLISWDGCTLGSPEKLRLLEQKLRAEKDPAGWRWFPKLLSGPGAIEELTEGAAGLDRDAAIERLEGALVGPPKLDAQGQSLGDGSRTTCLLAFLDSRLTDSNLVMRRAVERVRDLAHAECGVPLADIHMGGPPVDNITIDIEGERTLIRLAGLSGIVGLSLSYLAFRSMKITAMVFWTAGVSAGASLALVYWYGVFEVLGLGLDSPRLGAADAILMSMPAVVYVLALSGAIHLVNYYRDERLEHGLWGAAERAVRVGWGPCLLAAFTTAVGLGSLGTSDILPIQKFGVFSAIGVLATVMLLFAILPVFLHRFPPGRNIIEGRKPTLEALAHAWHAPLARFVTTRHTLTAVICVAVMGVVAIGTTRIQTSVQLLNLLDDSCDLITDYEWLEAHLGNLVPMEVIVALDAAQLRSPDEPAIDLAADGAPRYRMTMYERTAMVRRLQGEIESLPGVSRALSAVTFAAAPVDQPSASARRAAEYTTSQLLQQSRDSLLDYLRLEHNEQGEPTGRELWRVSARVTALGDIDYGRFVQSLKKEVEPVLDAYRLRDRLAARLAEQGLALDRADVCLLIDEAGAEDPRRPPEGSTAARLADVLGDSAIGGVTVYPLSAYEQADAQRQARAREQLAERFDAVVTLDPAAAGRLPGLDVLTLEPPPHADEPPPALQASTVYTGIVPLVYKTQRELLGSLFESIGWATVLIACVMMVVLRSPAAGVVSMLPNVFPIAMVFGSLGWLGIKVDIGIMMTASVALGVAVDDTLHFITWFRRGVREGLDRRTATRQAYERCATAMTQTTLIGGLGLAVFAVSTFTPTQQFGTLMITMLGMALIGDLVMLPAILCGPLGRFFAPGSPATPEEAARRDPPASASAAPPTPSQEPPHESSAGPSPGPRAEAAPLGGDPSPNRGPAPHEPLSPANAALREKLQKLGRRE
ncbi:MMPL family transporter [Botrimarina sp.]|uniref:efflux RND transporter permease subunit n=1 Tax=Botrimarina sp. TaxID=2795802 RepID=UPI0032EF4AB6